MGLEGIEALVGHPWFEIGPLFASERSAGKAFSEACRLDTSHLPPEIASRQVRLPAPGGDMEAVFSALPSADARKIEPEFARHVPVMSKELRRRNQGVAEGVRRIAWEAQKRLHKRLYHLIHAGKSSQKAVIALARELAGFIWAVGQEETLLEAT